MRLNFWRKWRKFGVNPLLHVQKIKQFQGFAVSLSTCRPCTDLHIMLSAIYTATVNAGRRLDGIHMVTLCASYRPVIVTSNSAVPGRNESCKFGVNTTLSVNVNGTGIALASCAYAAGDATSKHAKHRQTASITDNPFFILAPPFHFLIGLIVKLYSKTEG